MSSIFLISVKIIWIYAHTYFPPESQFLNTYPHSTVHYPPPVWAFLSGLAKKVGISRQEQNRFSRRIMNGRQRRKNPEAPGFPVLYSGPSCSPVCISIPKPTTESSHQLPTFSRCTIFHILTFLNSGCTSTTHMFVVRAMIHCPNTLFRAKAPIPQVLGVGSPPAFPHRA